MLVTSAVGRENSNVNSSFGRYKTMVYSQTRLGDIVLEYTTITNGEWRMARTRPCVAALFQVFGYDVSSKRNNTPSTQPVHVISFKQASTVQLQD